jgi:cytochrome b
MPLVTGPICVWDLPTRLFHWLLVALFGFSWWSAENREMEWHLLSGSLMLGLIAFRILWGFIGGSTARFSAFLRTPGRVIAYLRALAGPHLPGHNPVGGYSVALMLALLIVQVGSGLFAVDVDGIDSGQLSHWVSFDQGRIAAGVHEISFTLLQIVAAIHIMAIVFYLVARRRNLLRPMLTGADSQLDNAQGALVPASPLRFALALAVAAGLAWWASAGFPV